MTQVKPILAIFSLLGYFAIGLVLAVNRGTAVRYYTNTDNSPRISVKHHLSIVLVPDHQTDPTRLVKGLLANLGSDSRPIEVLLTIDTSSVNVSAANLLFEALSSEHSAVNVRLFQADLTQLGLAQFLQNAIDNSDGDYLTVLPSGVVFSTPHLLSSVIDGIALYERSLVSVPCYALNADRVAQDLAGYSCFSNAEFPPYAKDGYLCSHGLSCVYVAPRSLWLAIDCLSGLGNTGWQGVHQFLLAAFDSLTEMASECLLLAGEAVFFAPGYLPEPVSEVLLSPGLRTGTKEPQDPTAVVTLFGNFSAEAMQLLGKSCAGVEGRDFER